MLEPCKEGLANHLDPESCAGGGEATGEALTGAHAGQPLSSEITLIGVETHGDGEAKMEGGDQRKPSADATESETVSMRGNSMRENRETPTVPSPIVARDGRRRLWPYVRHIRCKGVGRRRSTCEAGEQGRPVGGCGARGGRGGRPRGTSPATAACRTQCRAYTWTVLAADGKRAYACSLNTQGTSRMS
jgi:hypothetical protein